MNNYGFDYFNYISNLKDINPNNQIPINFTNNILNQQTQQLTDPYQGLIRGNLFANLYQPYRNYQPQEINPDNEKNALLYQLMQYKFALIELNLYLDTHPDDNYILSLYHKYLDIEKQMCNQYEKMYGPLTTDSINIGNNQWTWKNSPWPWEEM